MHRIDKYVKQMLAGRDVVIVTTGPARTKTLQRRIVELAGDCIQITEHTRQVIRRAGPGSILFTHISSTDVEAAFLASSVVIDGDISLNDARKSMGLLPIESSNRLVGRGE